MPTILQAPPDKTIPPDFIIYPDLIQTHEWQMGARNLRTPQATVEKRTCRECGTSLETHRNPQGNLQSAIIRQANSPQRHYVAPKGLNATTLKLVDQNAFYHDLMEKLSPGMNRATAYRTRLVRDPRASRTGFTEIIRRFLSGPAR